MELNETKLKEIFENVKNITGGNVADYIPQLKNVNPNLFGVSICNIAGKKINFGDSNYRFCLQSCSKPLSYCIAHQLYGRQHIHKRVGYEPSGHKFNTFILNKEGLPHNPMINAGAIMVASQIGKDLEPSVRFNIIKEYYNKMAGMEKEVGFDNSVFLSEKHHADRNISLAYYMRENKAFQDEISPNQIIEALDLYFQQCSITIDCEMGAIIAATLANNGICPVTSEQVFDSTVIKDCLTLMYGCGMYDYSGEFAFEVGLPAKSGVSGCILLVIPNNMGICIWSPPLDHIGNSLKGIAFCKQLSEELELHIFHNLVSSKIDYQNEENINQKFINYCSKGDIENITKILEHVDINTTDYDKRSGLHLAATEGHVQTVKLLLEKNANLTKDRWGNTPLSEVANKKGEQFETINRLFAGK